jgi:TBC1 domain family member 10
MIPFVSQQEQRQPVQNSSQGRKSRAHPLQKASTVAKATGLRATHAPSPLSLPQNNSVASLPGGSSTKPHPWSGSTQITTSSNSRPVLQKIRHVSSSTALSNTKQPAAPAPIVPQVLRRTFSPAAGVASSSAQSYSSLPMQDSRSSIVPSEDKSRETAPQEQSEGYSPTSGEGSYESSGLRKKSLGGRVSLSPLRSRANGGFRRSDESMPLTKDSGDFETVQIKDMEFELVRPVIAHHPKARQSEDDSAFGARESRASSDGGGLLRVHSPSLSISSAGHSGVRSPSSTSEFPFAALKGARPSDPDQSSIEAHRQRELKWVSLMSTVPAAQARKNKKVKKLVFEGVPSSVRYLVWAHLTDSKARGMPGLYTQLINRGRISVTSEIEADVVKLFPEHTQLHGQTGPVASLLRAYLAMVPDVRYHMGMLWNYCESPGMLTSSLLTKA